MKLWLIHALQSPQTFKKNYVLKLAFYLQKRTWKVSCLFMVRTDWIIYILLGANVSTRYLEGWRCLETWRSCSYGWNLGWWKKSCLKVRSVVEIQIQPWWMKTLEKLHWKFIKEKHLCQFQSLFVFVFLCPRRILYILKSHCPSVPPSVCLTVRAITLYCMNGFPYNLAEVFGISRRCVTRKNHVPISKVKVTLSFSMLICMFLCPGCNFLMHGRILK